MAKSTFTNEELCIAWDKQAQEGGTRRDVVRCLLEQMEGKDPENETDCRKCYNNVTQRKKQLTSHKTKPIVFADLTPGKKGARRTDDQMEALQALMPTATAISPEDPLEDMTVSFS